PHPLPAQASGEPAIAIHRGRAFVNDGTAVVSVPLDDRCVPVDPCAGTSIPTGGTSRAWPVAVVDDHTIAIVTDDRTGHGRLALVHTDQNTILGTQPYQGDGAAPATDGRYVYLTSVGFLVEVYVGCGTICGTIQTSLAQVSSQVALTPSIAFAISQTEIS